jgi:alpha-1,3-rhamnosyl/mannosyltransferase
MTIGIDAGALSVTDDRLKVGVYRVTESLVDAVLSFPAGVNLRRYGFGQMKKPAEFSERVADVIIRPPTGYMSVRLPIELLLHPVECFIAASQAVPSWTGSPVLGCIYDLSFYREPDAYPGSYASLVSHTEQVVKKSKHIVTISECVKSDIVKQFSIPPERITVAYPPVDPRFRIEGQGYRHPRPYFLSVGALKIGKHIPTMIEAFAKFSESHPDIDLLIAGGDFWPDDHIDRAIKKHHLESRVILLGHVADDVLNGMYRSAIALLTVSPNEGFCLPAAESMASGIPVIGVSSGAMPETVGTGGILVAPDDIAAISQSMSDMVAYPGKRNRLSLRAKKESERFTQHEFRSRIWDALRSIVLT